MTYDTPLAAAREVIRQLDLAGFKDIRHNTLADEEMISVLRKDMPPPAEVRASFHLHNDSRFIAPTQEVIDRFVQWAIGVASSPLAGIA